MSMLGDGASKEAPDEICQFLTKGSHEKRPRLKSRLAVRGFGSAEEIAHRAVRLVVGGKGKRVVGLSFAPA